jgi:uncharacterized protein (TIGR03790 family)
LIYRGVLALAAVLLFGTLAHSEQLSAARLGVLYNVDDPASREIAAFYAMQRKIPADNVIGIHLPNADVMTPEAFTPLRMHVLDLLPTAVQSLALVWSKPYAVGCMSITTAMAAGYRGGFCLPGCAATLKNPLFDSDGWLPADTVGWWPAMLLPSNDTVRARALVQRGIAADGSRPAGTLYLTRTQDTRRNVRAGTYPMVQLMLERRLRVAELAAPVLRDVPDAIGYFTGTAQVEELSRLHFLPGAIADHLTSGGGVLEGGSQMAVLSWLEQGATASYGSVSEPCNRLEKFPDIAALFDHYLHGETVLEAYWKSVAMPGQGLFVGEPLTRPFGVQP